MAAKTVVEERVEVPRENFDQIPMPLPSEVLTINHRFTLNIQSDGKIALTIRTNEEDELEQLLEKWEARIVVFQEPVNGHRNGNGHANGNGNGNKPRYFPGDDCPSCHNKLVKRSGRNGAFLGCRSYPDCDFTQKL